MKFNLPMSEAVTVLALGVSQWKDAYVSANQLEHMYDSIEWPLDYFMKCWPSSHDIYYAQVIICQEISQGLFNNKAYLYFRYIIIFSMYSHRNKNYMIYRSRFTKC